MTDRIRIEGMVFEGTHGVHEHEQRTPQPFEIDLELVLDLVPAGRTDDLDLTIDYSAVFTTCRGIVETLSGHRSTAVLMRNHGPFTIGTDARDAVKAAVMVEDVARTVHVARQLGEPLAIDQGSIDALFARYQNIYGQPAEAAT